MAEGDKEDRTEAPSAKRLTQAREEGRVAVSRELQSLSGLGIAVLVLIMTVPPQAGQFVIQMRGLMENAGTIDVSGGGAFVVLQQASRSCAALAGPVLLAAAVGAVVTTMMQTGFLFRFQGLMPQPGRLKPMKGISRIVSGETAVEALKSVVKLAAFGFAVWHVLGGLFPVLLRSEGWNAAVLASRMARLTLGAVLLVLACPGGGGAARCRVGALQAQRPVADEPAGAAGRASRKRR
jgi:flagellar biosynthetic protein FlhB